MSFLLIDTGRYQPDHMVHAIKQEFNIPIRSASSLSAAMEILVEHSKTIELVIFNTEDESFVIQPVLKWLNEKSRHCATLLLTSQRPKKNQSLITTDTFLLKPVLTSKLVKAIIDAYECKNKKNNTIALISKQKLPNKIDLYEIFNLDSYSDSILQKNLLGIILDSTTLSAAEAIKIKKQLRGTIFPVGLYGTEGACAWTLSEIATDFYFEEESFTDIIRHFALAAEKFLLRRLLTQRLKTSENTGRAQDTLKTARLLKKVDPRSPISLTFSGNALERMNQYSGAVEKYKEAIDKNPFFPENYLRILRLHPNDREILIKAKKYCPNHPGIKNYS